MAGISLGNYGEDEFDYNIKIKLFKMDSIIIGTFSNPASFEPII